MEKIFWGTVVIADTFLLVTLVLGIFLKQSLVTSSFINWLLVHIGFLLFIECTSQLVFHFDLDIDTRLIHLLYIAGEFFILMQLFITALSASFKWRIIAGIAALGLLINTYLVWQSGETPLSSFGKTLSHLTIACVAGYTLIQGLQKIQSKDYSLLVCAAFFLYYLGSLFLFHILHQLTYTGIFTVWILNNILVTTLYCCCGFIFYTLRVNKKKI